MDHNFMNFHSNSRKITKTKAYLKHFPLEVCLKDVIISLTSAV